MRFTQADLVERVKKVIKETKSLPTDSRDLNLDQSPSLRENPYWSVLLDNIEEEFGSLQTFYDRFIPKNFLEKNAVPFPSQEQEEITTQMLERSRLLIRDGAGAGKTAPVIKAKLALEQLVLEGEKINPIIVCPNFVISSWESKLREYLTDRQKVSTITSGNREEAIQKFEEEIANGTSGWTLVSYDALFRSVNNTAQDSIAHEIAGLRKDEPKITADQVTLADRMLSAVENSQGQMMLVLDESHNAKSPKALRSRAVRKLALGADRFYAMTGSPFPDNLEDIGELASLLEPENFKTADDFNRAYEGNPRLIRLFLRRFSKEPVVTFRDLPGVPNVNINPPTYLCMSPDEEKLYWSILEHKEFGMGRKFVLTRLAATDGTLLLPENQEGKSRKKMEPDQTRRPPPQRRSRRGRYRDCRFSLDRHSGD